MPAARGLRNLGGFIAETPALVGGLKSRIFIPLGRIYGEARAGASCGWSEDKRKREFRFIFHDLLIRIEKSAKLREMVLLKYIVDC